LHFDVSIRKLRLLTVLVTVLTLPGYGLAGVASRSCQEQMSSPHGIAVTGDCCPGKADPNTGCKQDGNSPAGQNGPCSACKAGHNCKSSQSFEPAHVIVLLTLPARMAPPVIRPQTLVTYSPDGLWRPPRHI
jgi:hypothetical protein